LSYVLFSTVFSEQQRFRDGGHKTATIWATLQLLLQYTIILIKHTYSVTIIFNKRRFSPFFPICKPIGVEKSAAVSTYKNVNDLNNSTPTPVAYLRRRYHPPRINLLVCVGTCCIFNIYIKMGTTIFFYFIHPTQIVFSFRMFSLSLQRNDKF